VVNTTGWLDSLLYANSNALFSNWDNGQVLETPFNYTAVSSFTLKQLRVSLTYF
jgi:hypothetical protein